MRYRSHSQTHQSNCIGSKYQSTQIFQLNGSSTTTKFDAASASAPVHLNKSLTKYENKREDKSNFGGYRIENALGEGSYSMGDNLNGNFKQDNATEDPVIDHKFNV